MLIPPSLSLNSSLTTLERKDNDTAPWTCDKCATDADTPWIDPKPNLKNFGFGSKYRVTAYNADGKASEPSAER